MHRAEEGGIGIGGTVMRNLEDVGPQIGAGRQQVVLRLDLGVAGQQDPHPGHGGPQHHRGVVRVGAGIAVGPPWPEHLQPERPGVQHLAGDGRFEHDPATGQLVSHQPVATDRIEQR